jgi:phage tail-like protein
MRGRYLKVRAELQGNGLSTPEIAAVRAYGSRFSYVDKYLPELYREDSFGPDAEVIGSSTPADFLERFVDNFEGVLTPLEDRIADSYLLTDADTVPSESLDWLGNWIGLSFDTAYSDTQRRQLLKSTPELYRHRGTLLGLGLALDIATGGAVSRGQIVILENWRLRRTFATILGANLDDDTDPLLAGITRSGNSFVGDTLFIGDTGNQGEAVHQEFLALFNAAVQTNQTETDTVNDFFDDFANRLTILVHQEIEPQDLGLVRRVARLETPAHVAVRIERASNSFRAAVTSLVGVDTYLAPKPTPRNARIDVSYFGGGDLIGREPALDPRLGGEDRAGRPPTAQVSAPEQVEPGVPFALSAADSKAFEGRKIVEYIWTMLD